MNHISGLVLASVITGAIGAHGLVFGDPSWDQVLWGFVAGASFSVIFAMLLFPFRKMGLDLRSAESHRVLTIALASLSGTLAAWIWFATQLAPPPIYVCLLAGTAVGFGFGWAGSRGPIGAQ